jgi:xanthine dehydrogenase accessory factor
LVTLFNLDDRKASQPGTCYLYRNEKDQFGASSRLPLDIVQDLEDNLDRKRSSFKKYKEDHQSLTAFIEYVELPVALMIIGAGNDVYPLVDFANILGWEPHVIDGRANYATQDRFASACSILVAKPEKVLEQIKVDHRTVFVLMTHNYNYDLAMLQALLLVDTPYIGSLGPKKKLDRMLDELKTAGFIPTPDQLNKIFGPTGLDLGAETPEEIALSIISEIQSILKNSNPINLREAGEFIHSREGLKIVASDNS